MSFCRSANRKHTKLICKISSLLLCTFVLFVTINFSGKLQKARWNCVNYCSNNKPNENTHINSEQAIEREKKTHTIENNNLYNKNAEICLWLFLDGAGYGVWGSMLLVWFHVCMVCSSFSRFAVGFLFACFLPSRFRLDLTITMPSLEQWRKIYRMCIDRTDMKCIVVVIARCNGAFLFRILLSSQ